MVDDFILTIYFIYSLHFVLILVDMSLSGFRSTSVTINMRRRFGWRQDQLSILVDNRKLLMLNHLLLNTRMYIRWINLNHVLSIFINHGQIQLLLLICMVILPIGREALCTWILKWNLIYHIILWRNTALIVQSSLV